jgi:hypothetical protein
MNIEKQIRNLYILVILSFFLLALGLVYIWIKMPKKGDIADTIIPETFLNKKKIEGFSAPETPPKYHFMNNPQPQLPPQTQSQHHLPAQQINVGNIEDNDGNAPLGSRMHVDNELNLLQFASDMQTKITHQNPQIVPFQHPNTKK